MLVEIKAIQSIEQVKGGYLIQLNNAKPILVRGTVDVLMSNLTGYTTSTLSFILDNQDKLALNLPLMESEEENGWEKNVCKDNNW